MSAKQRYIALSQEKDLPIFLQPWYLDVVCNQDWDVFLYEKNDKILAALPYLIRRSWGFRVLTIPTLQPFNGLWINYSSCKNIQERYSLENRVLEAFAVEVDSKRLAYFNYKLSSDNFFSMGMQFHGFEAHVRYTYRLEISDIEECFKAFNPDLRTKIRKAEKQYQIQENQADLHQVYQDLILPTYSDKGHKIPYSYNLFETLVQQALKYNQGKILSAADNQGNILAVLFVVWDNQTCYSLIPATKKTKGNNATSLLNYYAMKMANSLGLQYYDFEGSMIKNIEHYFRLFSPKQTPYIMLEKKYSWLYDTLRNIKAKL